MVEIGTATGMSAAHLCRALDVASQARLIQTDFRVATYDISTMWQPDPNRKIGDGAREQLSPELLDHIVFRNPAQAFNAAKDFPPDSIRFAFIDANHGHPWPTLDLLVLLDCLAAGATVVLHDINLPIIKPQSSVWGAKYLFDALGMFKQNVPDDSGRMPNIGSFVVPNEKTAFREQLLRVLYAHPWQAKISADHLRRLDVEDAISSRSGQI